MKPSKILPLALVLFVLSATWVFSMWAHMDWYVDHIPNDILMGIMITAALTMLFTSLLYILSKLE